MQHHGHDQPQPPAAPIVRLRARCRSLRDQLARSLDAREHVLEISERQAADLVSLQADNASLRRALATTQDELARVRDELAVERAQRAQGMSS